MVRRISIDREHLGPLLTAPGEELGAEGSKADTPVMVWTAPVFDDARTYGRAAAVMSLEAVACRGCEPVGAVQTGFLPRGSRPRLWDGLAEGSEEVFHGVGVPFARSVGFEGRLAVGHAVQVRSRRRRPRRPARPGDPLRLSRPLGADVLFEAYLGQRRTAGQTREWVANATRADSGLLRRVSDAPAAVLGPSGLAGASMTLAQRWGLDVVLDAQRLPALTGALQHLLSGVTPASVARNRSLLGRGFAVARGVPEAAARLASGAEWTGGVLWVGEGPDGVLVGELRRPRGSRPVVRLMASVDLPEEAS